MELDKLLVKIEADTTSLQRGLQDAKNKINKSTSRMGNDFKRLGTSLDALGGRVIKFGGLLAGAFGIYQVVQVINVGKQVENLQVRLKALFGTAEEGAKAFEVMRKFASRVPFSLEEIQQASGNLAVISEDANELGEVLEITGNVASATGLDFRQASEQIQRSFAGGIASADVFRERGVRAMLGFNAGAKVSINDTIKAFKEKFGQGGEFGNVTNDFAKTLTGTLSMLSDKLFNFRLAISEEFMKALKKEFGDLDDSLQVNSENIEKFGREVGQSLADLTTSVVKNAEEIKLAFEVLFAVFGTAIAVKAINYIKNLNVVTGTLLATLIAYNELTELNRQAIEKDAEATNKLAESNNFLGANISGLFEEEEKVTTAIEKHAIAIEQLILQQQLLNGVAGAYPKVLEKTVEAVNPFAEAFARVFETLRGESIEFEKIFDKAVKNIGDAFGDAIAKGEDFGDAMKGIFQGVISQVISLIVQLLILKPILDSIKANLGTGGGGFSGMFSDLTSFLGFANGGYIAPNKPAIVGEQGAEVFVPHTAGHIVPNDEMGGGVNVVQNISFSTGIVPTVRSEVMNMLPLIKQQTITAVAEQRSRGGAFAKTFGA